MLTTAHIQRYQGWMGQWLSDVGAGWAKIVNPEPGFVLPTPQSLVRIWTDMTDGAYIARGREGGKAFVREMWPRWQQNAATCYSLWNEPDVNSNAGLANLREAYLGAIEQAAALGIRVCVGEFAEGNPHNNNSDNEEPTIWKLNQLRPALVAAADAGMPWAPHAYWRPLVEGPTGRWHALGRIEWDQQVLNIPKLRTLVSETGIDGGIAGHPGKQGWQKLTTAPLYQGEVVQAEQYGRRIQGLEALMLFGFGAKDEWLAGGFDIPEGLARGLVAPLKALDVAAQTPEDASGRLIIELARPLDYTAATNKVTQWFGENPAMYAAYGLAGHNGLDYRAPHGTQAKAIHPGVARVYDQGSIGLGRYVKVIYLDGKGAQRYETREAHLSEWKVRDGELVKRGQVIGLTGNTGNSTDDHLHVDLKVYGMRNPAYGDRIDLSPWRTV